MATRFWILSNEDSRALFFRKQHLEKNGGVWSYGNGTGWVWDKTEPKTEKNTIEESVEEPKEQTKTLFKRKKKENKK